MTERIERISAKKKVALAATGLAVLSLCGLLEYAREYLGGTLNVATRTNEASYMLYDAQSNQVISGTAHYNNLVLYGDCKNNQVQEISIGIQTEENQFPKLTLDSGIKDCN